MYGSSIARRSTAITRSFSAGASLFKKLKRYCGTTVVTLVPGSPKFCARFRGMGISLTIVNAVFTCFCVFLRRAVAPRTGCFLVVNMRTLCTFTTVSQSFLLKRTIFIVWTAAKGRYRCMITHSMAPYTLKVYKFPNLYRDISDFTWCPARTKFLAKNLRSNLLVSYIYLSFKGYR